MSDFGNEHEIHFSNAVITWEIEKFPLIISSQNSIRSSKITLSGPVKTRWEICLYKSMKRNRLQLKVAMLSNKSEIGKVELHWAFCLLDENLKGSFSNERTYSYVPKTVLSLEYLPFNRVLEIANKNIYGNLILQFRILVDFGLKKIYPKPNVYGVFDLSRSLRKLPTSFLHHDTTITVNDVEFSLHRAMLSIRGEKFVSYLQECARNMKNKFSLQSANAATSVFTYIYTGDLKFIWDEPCLTISDFIESLEIPELDSVYNQQKIEMSSKMELKEHEINWEVLDLKNANRTTVGPTFVIEDVKSSFQIILNVLESEDYPQKKSLFVEVELIETETELLLCLEFACGEDEKQKLFPQRIVDVMNAKSRVGVTLLESDRPEMEEYFLKKSLFIHVKASMCDGEVKSRIVENNITLPKITNDKSRMSLSVALGEMRKNAVYSDFYFEVGEQVFQAHKFLVAARSSLLKELLRRHEGVASVTVYDCSKEVFEKFLCYVYMGLLLEKDGDNLIELYYLGSQYNVTGLLSIVPEFLSKCINEENMLRVLIFADDINDDKLNKTAFDYVKAKVNILQNHVDHDKFRSKKPEIYAKVLELEAQE